MNLLINSGPLGDFWTRNLLETPCAYGRQLDGLGAGLEHTHYRNDLDFLRKRTSSESRSSGRTSGELEPMLRRRAFVRV
jgi:hypothetical protein